ncbi:copper amine oxidase N-terminal domain-containing protein [Paenibacillus sp. M1]|uniref:Copper amine oxidase N-terminal domain-containing protein n=1 Tax=Paenibacillus haidiansis TaxID=1574488 RepID=A0ABU7VSQ4_9BACL
MRKIWTTFLAALLVVPLLLQNTAQAATPISVYIDGAKLATDQAPVVVQSRVLLPLRAIFEALDATVNWNQWTQTVTATRDNTTVVLKLKSKTATINNETVTLDVPAQAINGRTLVPVRFVSEALGSQVDWNSASKRVAITSNRDSGQQPQPGTVSPVSYVTAKDVANNGDGRDLQVSFSRSSSESLVDHYRILVVKAANASSFNLTSALKVSSSNYTTLRPNGADPSVTLASSARDVDGTAIQTNQSYVVYVLAIGKSGYGSALSNASAQLVLGTGVSVDAATNVKASDNSDYGDGRDLSVSFTRAQSESNISNYRIFIVKTKDAGSFNLAAAASNQYYTNVSKSGTGTTLIGNLSSSSRDTSGELIKNGVSYTAYVLSVSNTSTASNKLSAASGTISLSKGAVTAPVITQVDDRSDYGDGRDLRVSFTKVSDESKISGYRIFVVKAGDYGDFTLSRANAVSSSNYTEISKTGYNQSPYLSSSARDVDGDKIKNGTNYRVFVMAVGTSANNALSSASSSIKLLNNYGVGAISDLEVSDVNDYNDGRDLLVSFDRASDESNIGEYRIMVVKSSNAGSFTVSKASKVTSKNYTVAAKGKDYNSVLSSGARDVDGDKIQNGTSYRVFVLSVGKGSYEGENTLSAQSSSIKLANNYSVAAVVKPEVSDVSDYDDGRDLQVTFNRASDESNISNYRIFVVKSSDASSFTLAKASKNGYYTQVSKAGNTLSQVLSSKARDIDGDLIEEGVKYRVFVLSVGSGSYSGNNALSTASDPITLADNLTVQAVSGLSVSTETANSTGTAGDIKVSFNKPANETNIAEYRILVVPAAQAGGFTLEDANSVTVSGNYTSVTPNGGNVSGYPVHGPNDAFGDPIDTETTYRVFVLSVAKTGSGEANKLSAASSNQVKVNPAAPAAEPATITAVTALSNSEIQVSFTEPGNTSNVASYMIVATEAGTPVDYNAVLKAGYSVQVQKGNTGETLQGTVTRDLANETIDTSDSAYDVYILSVPTDTSSPNGYALSGKFTITTME